MIRAICRLLLIIIIVSEQVRAEQKIRFVPLQIKDRIYHLELAISPEQRERGLMFRKELPEDGGMLFVFESEQILYFWMKNTLLTLDMIFINEKNEVVKIYHSVPPCRQEPCDSYSSVVPARYVIELNSGQCKQLGLKIGDLIFINPKLHQLKIDKK